MQPSRENVDLRSIVGHCESLLNPTGIEDYKGAVNGLQVENSGKVTHIGAAVDASLHVIQRAIDLHVDLLIVHHGSSGHPASHGLVQLFESPGS
ncbi:MAG: Nif3-like dinuclear metal center hexameric protein [Verrucomicrobia bacterium]|nr:Nif3-like dinuclear metal center hexameric protein [Verrucomicrobiota bacterium]